MKATAAMSPLANLEAEIARIAAHAKGVVCVAAWRLDGKGPRVALNVGDPFPMASTFKVAVAGAILAKVDRRELRLDRMVDIDPELHVSSEVIADSLIHPGVSLSVHNLVELMITQSDNTATDVLIGLDGGPAGVTAWVRAQGVEGLRIDRDTAGLVRDFYGLPAGPFAAALEAGVKADPELLAKGSLPNPAFDDDPRDTATPDAMVRLLDRIFNGQALTPESTKLLTETMQRNRTGGKRIRGQLPAGVVVADKTGTIGGTVNDVGVVTLPADAGRVVLGLFVKKSALPVAAREEVIADIARAIYDSTCLKVGDDGPFKSV